MVSSKKLPELIATDAYPHAAFEVGTDIAPVWIGFRDPRDGEVFDRASGYAV